MGAMAPRFFEIHRINTYTAAAVTVNLSPEPPSQHCGMSLAIWDHAVLPST